ncbi:MAG: SDR family oxidoreductase [Campylobacterota bacterium]|nr:SDR family oxidoreductase [Campylobacterota bacterium]
MAHNFKIAIMGGTGLLGSNLVEMFKEKYEIKVFSRQSSGNISEKLNSLIDFNLLEDELERHFISWKPDIILNAVALVNLDRCEVDFKSAYEINCNIAYKLSSIAKKINSYFIHISTDHYYNDKKTVHNEKDKILILNNYSKTKYEAENLVINNYKNTIVVRTNIVGFRNNDSDSFFEWLIDSFEKKETINLYKNYFTSPISVKLLGDILIKCYTNKLNGLYNIASSEVISKYDFGLKVAKRFGFDIKCINKTNFANDQKIKRALTLGLDVSRIEEHLNYTMPKVDETIEQLYKEYLEIKDE